MAAEPESGGSGDRPAFMASYVERGRDFRGDRGPLDDRRSETGNDDGLAKRVRPNRSRR